MSHYSDNPASVRVDFFKPSGKWYCTEAIIWTGAYRDSQLHAEFARSLGDHLQKGSPPHLLRVPSPRFGELRLSDMLAVCLHPYHERSHPITMLVNEIEKYVRDAK